MSTVLLMIKPEWRLLEFKLRTCVCPNLDSELPEICFELGNDVSAIDSVPTALFCFLRFGILQLNI